MLEKFATPCFEKDDTTKDDFEHVFREGKDPETMPQKCLITCMQELVEIIKGGEFQPENFKVLIKASVNDESKNAIIDDIAKECVSVQEENRCEYGIKLTLCYKKTAEKNGVDFDKMQGK